LPCSLESELDFDARQERNGVKPTSEDMIEIARVLALWGHIMDDRELDRLGECLTTSN
jgi:hypothetical protein